MSHCIALRAMQVHCNTVHYVALHWNFLLPSCSTLHSSPPLPCIALHEIYIFVDAYVHSDAQIDMRTAKQTEGRMDWQIHLHLHAHHASQARIDTHVPRLAS